MWLAWFASLFAFSSGFRKIVFLAMVFVFFFLLGLARSPQWQNADPAWNEQRWKELAR